MEIVVVAVVIVAYCLILGVGPGYVMTGILMLTGILAALMSIAFLGSAIGLLFSKKKKAEFVRLEQSGRKYKSACYLVEGREYRCLFPCEGIMQDKLYVQGREYSVMFNRRMGMVYDRFAVATCVLGLVAGVSICLIIGAFLI